jgi:hypothetical protein
MIVIERGQLVLAEGTLGAAVAAAADATASAASEYQTILEAARSGKRSDSDIIKMIKNSDMGIAVATEVVTLQVQGKVWADMSIPAVTRSFGNGTLVDFGITNHLCRKISSTAKTREPDKKKSKKKQEHMICDI